MMWLNSETLLIPNFQWFLLVVTAWVLPWKGVALWKAARNKHKFWFIVLLVVNTLAVLEILYIFIFSKIKIKQSFLGKIRQKFHR